MFGQRVVVVVGYDHVDMTRRRRAREPIGWPVEVNRVGGLWNPRRILKL